MIPRSKACARRRSASIKPAPSPASDYLSRGGAPVVKPSRLQNLLAGVAQRLLAATSVAWSLDAAVRLVARGVGFQSNPAVLLPFDRNAREGHAGGGRLALRAENTDVRDADSLPLAPGPYLKLTFEDSGVGIAPEHIASIFRSLLHDQASGKKRGSGSAWPSAIPF
jgi:hypothetical protein